MSKMSLAEAKEYLGSLDIQVRDISKENKFFKYEVLKGEEREVFLNGWELVSWVKKEKSRRETSDASDIMDLLLCRYYTADFQEKAPLFFEIDECLRRNISDLSPELIMRARNVIVLG